MVGARLGPSPVSSGAQVKRKKKEHLALKNDAHWRAIVHFTEGSKSIQGSMVFQCTLTAPGSRPHFPKAFPPVAS